MSFGYNRINYGIHSICPYRISDQLPYGILKVVGGGQLTLSSESEELFGGSNKFAWAVEAKTISTEWTASVKSMPDFLFELFLGATVTKTAASATGTVSALVNVSGTLQNATTGIASIAAKAGAENDLKDGVYILEAVSATTINVRALTDIEAKKAEATNNFAYQDEDLSIYAAPLAVVASSQTELLGLGLEITGGSGTIALNVGDTARVEVSSAHNGVSEISIGSQSTIFKEHRQLCLGQKRANGDVFEIDLFRVIGQGMPLPLEEQAFSIPELSMKLVQDSENDIVAKIRAKRGI